MDIRNVQKSGTTYYVYLPAAWCRENNITTACKLSLETSSEGDLVIVPHSKEQQSANLFLNLPLHDMRVVNKFIVAAYLNPVKSFRIKLDRKISSLEILDHKRLLSGIEIVEFGGDQISCESSISLDDPDTMLKTMVKKLTNMLHVMVKEEAHELLDRYEEEIDRSKTLILKSAVSSLMFRRRSQLRNIDLFYVASLAQSLEGFADQLVHLRRHPGIAKKSLALMNLMLKTLDNLCIPSATAFAKDAVAVCASLEKADASGRLDSLKTNVNQCADTIVDWAITKETTGTT